MYEEAEGASTASWGVIESIFSVKSESGFFDSESSSEEPNPLLCVVCNLDFSSESQYYCHHLRHVSSPSVVLSPLPSQLSARLLAGKSVKKRPGPRSKTEGLVPADSHSPIKLTFKRLSTCHEPAFEVVCKKESKKLAAMDEMIPEGVEENQIPSFPQTPSPSPSDILRQEVNADRSSWEVLARSFGFLAPEPPEGDQEAEKVVNGDSHSTPKLDDNATSNEDLEPPAMAPSEPTVPTDPPLTNGNPGKVTEQESSDSGCEKDGSEKDFNFDSNAERTPPPPSTNPSPSLGGLTIKAPSELNSSVTNGSESASGSPAPGESAPSGLIVKTFASIGAVNPPGAVTLLNTDSLMRGYVEPDFLETCEVCGDKSGKLEEHKAELGHYKCLEKPECTTIYATAAELSTHQQMAHNITPPPNHQSLQQLQQQVQRIPVPFGVPPGITLSYPAGSGSAAASPSSTPTPPLTPTIQARPFALATSPSTMRPDGSPVASPALPAGLGRSISISPSVSVKPGQKRGTPTPPVVETTKRSRADSPDCELVDVQQPLPKLPGGISLTVRGSSKDSGVTDILSKRGITVTPAASKAPVPAAPRANSSPQLNLNLGSAVSIVPASQSKSQFAVPQGRRAPATTVRTPTVDLTQDNDRPVSRRNRPQRFTCQVCDKVFSSQETLNTHLTTHRSPSKLQHRCNLCNAQYPSQQALLQHKQTYHKEAQGSEMALPVVDMKAPGTVQKLAQLGIRHCLILSQLGNSSGGVFGLPIVAIDNARNPAISNLAALGASNVLSMGPAKALR